MSQPFELLDVVALTEDIPEEQLERGDVGTIVDVYDDGRAFEVEFCNRRGETLNMLALAPSQLLKLRFERQRPEPLASTP